jgi:hypothetical protein
VQRFALPYGRRGAAPHDAPAEAHGRIMVYEIAEMFAAFTGVENKVNPLPPGATEKAL